MNINDLSDGQLADLVRNGTYAFNTRFGTDSKSAQYLLVLAIPYGREDRVSNLEDAFNAFFDFVQADDYKERNLMVLEYNRKTGFQTTQTTLENIEAE